MCASQIGKAAGEPYKDFLSFWGMVEDQEHKQKRGYAYLQEQTVVVEGEVPQQEGEEGEAHLLVAVGVGVEEVELRHSRGGEEEVGEEVGLDLGVGLDLRVGLLQLLLQLLPQGRRFLPSDLQLCEGQGI